MYLPMLVMMTFATLIWCSFFMFCIVSDAADGAVTNIDVHRKPANLSEANEIICALQNKVSTCEQLLRENRWPLLVRGEIDRLFDRYSSSVTLTEDEVKDIRQLPGDDSKKRKMSRKIVCERMLLNLTTYAEIVSLKASIDEAHAKDEEITTASFCEVLADMYECIAENGAPYLRLKPGEDRPRVVNMLTADNVNKYLNILMQNVNEPPIKEYVPKENKKTSNSTNKAADSTPSEAAATTVTMGQESAPTATSGGKESVGTTTSSTGQEKATTTASVGTSTSTAANDLEKNATKNA